MFDQRYKDFMTNKNQEDKYIKAYKASKDTQKAMMSLYASDDKELIEALLLGRLCHSEIAELSGTSEENIELYAAMFYDVSNVSKIKLRTIANSDDIGFKKLMVDYGRDIFFWLIFDAPIDEAKVVEKMKSSVMKKFITCDLGIDKGRLEILKSQIKLFQAVDTKSKDKETGGDWQKVLEKFQAEYNKQETLK